jgi:hypothetical protein
MSSVLNQNKPNTGMKHAQCIRNVLHSVLLHLYNGSVCEIEPISRYVLAWRTHGNGEG